ncbi:MAG: helix-turn-helix domain-containing protein [Terracidiphilus sp.]
MDDMSFKSAEELQGILGEQLKSLRIAKNLDQRTTAEKAGISGKALRNLEAGRGSSVETLLRVLKALDSLEGIEMLAPKPSVNPIALLRSTGRRQRVRHLRGRQRQAS